MRKDGRRVDANVGFRRQASPIEIYDTESEFFGHITPHGEDHGIQFEPRTNTRAFHV